MKLCALAFSLFSSACFAQSFNFSSVAGNYRGSAVGDLKTACDASIVLEADGTIRFHLSLGDQEITLLDDPKNPRRTWRIEDVGIASFLIIDQAGENLALNTVILGIWDQDIVDVNPPYARGELHAVSLRAGGATDRRLDCSLLRRIPTP